MNRNKLSIAPRRHCSLPSNRAIKQGKSETTPSHVGYVQSCARLPFRKSYRAQCCLQRFSVAKAGPVQLGSGLVRQHRRGRKKRSISALGYVRRWNRDQAFLSRTLESIIPDSKLLS